MQLAFAIYKYFPFGGIQRDLLKIARAALDRGHRVRIYAIRWEAPLPEEELEIHLIPVEAIANHTLYERFAEKVLDHVRQHPVDLLVGMNKIIVQKRLRQQHQTQKKKGQSGVVLKKKRGWQLKR